MSERLFRYVDPWRMHAYAALGWNAIGECPSPHDGRPKAIMEWTNAGEPVQPPKRTVVRISAEEFVGGLVLEGNVVTSAAPTVAYMAKQRWTRRCLQDYCRRRGWSLDVLDEGDNLVEVNP
jgi:hypothetical protein